MKDDRNNAVTCLYSDDIETCNLPSFILEPKRALDRGFLLQVCPEGESSDGIQLEMTLTFVDGEVFDVEFPKHFMQDTSSGNEDCFVISTRGYKILEIFSIEGKKISMLIL